MTLPSKADDIAAFTWLDHASLYKLVETCLQLMSERWLPSRNGLKLSHWYTSYLDRLNTVKCPRVEQRYQHPQSKFHLSTTKCDRYLASRKSWSCYSPSCSHQVGSIHSPLLSWANFHHWWQRFYQNASWRCHYDKRRINLPVQIDGR